jgi:polyisoprenoid-binding protein YceI
MSLFAAFFLAATALAAPTTYKVDAGKGALYVVVKKDPDTIGAALSHDHVVRSTGYSGTFTWDPENPSGCSVSVNVPVSGLKVDEEKYRKKARLEGELDAGQREEVTENMLKSDQLDGSKYSTISFVSSSCSGTAEEVEVKGKLTIRGISVDKTVKLKITTEDGSIRAKGRVSLRATEYGFKPFSAGFGALKNEDKMKLYVDLRGKP